MSSLAEIADVVIGVDTHVNTHSAAIVDTVTGAVLAEMTVETTTTGYRELIALADEHAPVRAWAIEGTGGHGAGLARVLLAAEEVVIELDRPQRMARRHGAKTDPLDAIRAAREAMARPNNGTPRTGQDRQALSVLLAARRSAVEASTVAQQQLFALAVAAPESLREKLRGKKGSARVTAAARFRPREGWDTETATTAEVMRSLARRITALKEEAKMLEKRIHTIVRAWRTDLLDQPGVGPISAAVILCAWSHPGRLRGESQFAMLAGVAPIPANSGQTINRYRLNRRGDRQLNRALHTIVINRQRDDQATQAYTARRNDEGKTAPEIRRCLKRYVARDLYRLLEDSQVTP